MIINQTYLKQYSPIPLNYQLDEVMNYVNVAEKIWVKPLIGEELYDELQDEIDEDELTPEDATLLVDGGLWQYLAYATTYEALPFIWANISQVGITLGKSENADSITLKDLTYIQNHLRTQVEVLKDQVKDFLDENCASYPSYVCSDCDCSCNNTSPLNRPNPMVQMYKTRGKNTTIK